MKNNLCNEHIFQNSLDLFIGSLNQGYKQHQSFTHLKSTFPDEWYNFIVPTVTVDQFNWEESEKLRQAEIAKGYRVSYYIEERLLQQYQSSLEQRGYEEIGDDTYVALEMSKPFTITDTEFGAITEIELEAYKDLGVVCFPEWDNSREFSQLCFDLSQKDEADMLYKNIYIKQDDQMVCFGSVLASSKLKMAYFHNVATHPDYRRRGLFTLISKQLCNEAFKFGARTMFAIVEEEGASFKGYKKIGFKKEEKYTLFYK